MHLFSKVYGEGDPVVILHGLFGSLNNWNTLGRKLGEEFSVYLVDQRNHGRSPHDHVHTYPAMAEDLFEFFQAKGILSAHLIGHSMGGKTAMEFAISHPEAVRKLIVVDMSPRPTLARHDPILDALTGLRLERHGSRESIDEALKPGVPDMAVRQFLLTNLKREEDGHFAWKMNLDALKKNYSEINRGIENGRQFKGPVLFLKGGRSPYVTDEDRPVIKALFPMAEFRTIPGVGHWVHAESPDEFLAIVRKFISS
jgi:pimeloyl-ACP methyl ester carboxylesterase